jgi:uridine kinase
MKAPSIQDPYIIGISGASASGKTHFIKELQRYFSADELCVISQDDYYRPKNEQQLDEQGNINFDHPMGIDFDALRNDLESLKKGKVLEKVEYRFQVEEGEPGTFKLYPAPLIIIEGLFVFFVEEIFKLFDLKLVIDADDQIKLQRRLTRDTSERGIPEDYVMYQWNNHVFPAYEKYLMPFVPKADMVILNNEGFSNSLNMLSNHLRQLLGK